MDEKLVILNPGAESFDSRIIFAFYDHSYDADLGRERLSKVSLPDQFRDHFINILAATNGINDDGFVWIIHLIDNSISFYS